MASQTSNSASQRLAQISAQVKSPSIQSIGEVYIISGARTPTGKFNGALASIPAPQLGAIAIRSALEKARIPKDSISHVIMGNVLSAGVGQSPARQASIAAGLSTAVEAITVNKVCASGLKAVVLAAQNIQLGQSDAQVAGGMESMSRVPYYLPRKSQMPALGPVQADDGLQKDGLTDAYNQMSMGSCVEHMIKPLNITREMQDTYAIRSYERAQKAWKQEAFKDEIASVLVPGPKGDKTVSVDEGYLDVNFSRLTTLKPAFVKDGSITAANASTLNDGASAVVLVNRDLAWKHGHTSRVLARICGYADAAVDPVDFAIAPAKAVPIALARAGISKEQVAVWEFNEAFAAVIKVFSLELGIEDARVNLLGGAIALGHALGSSGCRILVTLLHQLKPGEYGVAAVCNGGGAATAMVVQRIESVEN